MKKHANDWPVARKDLELLGYLVEHDTKGAGQKFKMTTGAVNAWLFRIRTRVARCENYLRQIRRLRRISNRITKLTSSSKIEKRRLDEDDEIEDLR